jgi:hypothetical protein
MIKKEGELYLFYCPGCECNHGVSDKWNIDLKSKTISPSVLVRSTKRPPEPWEFDENRKIKGCKEVVCHSFVKNGTIRFLNDCTHNLAGKTVNMEQLL